MSTIKIRIADVEYRLPAMHEICKCEVGGVACAMCHGAGVRLVPDTDRMSDPQREIFALWVEEEAQAAARAERLRLLTGGKE